MKIAVSALAALLLAGICWAPPAAAQGVPQGSYLRSCGDAHMRGDTLVANCRTADGHHRHTTLGAVGRCVGDIGNNNGELRCNHRGGPGYGSSEPRFGEGRCDDLRREAEHLRNRLNHEWNPAERARIEGRLRDLREADHRCH